MKNTKRIILIMLLLSFAKFSAQDKNNVSSKIESTEVEGVFQIKAIASNKSPIHQSLSYQILAVKEGNTGNLSSSQQSGKFTLQPKESKQLSQMSLNLDKNDGLKVFLFIRDENNKTVKVQGYKARHEKSDNSNGGANFKLEMPLAVHC